MRSKFLSLSLLTKIFLSTLIISLVTFVLLALFLKNSFRSGLQDYFNESELRDARMLARMVGEVYSPENGWGDLRDNPQAWYELLERIGEHTTPTVISVDVSRSTESDNSAEIQLSSSLRNSQSTKRHDMAHKDLITTAFIPLGFRINILNLNGHIIAGNAENIAVSQRNGDIKLSKLDVLYQGTLVGYLTVAQSVLITAPLAEEFFNLQQTKMYFFVAIMFFVSFLCCAYLLKVYLAPLKEVEAGGQELMKGNYDYKAEVYTKDEIGRLSDTFNSLTKFLKSEKAKRDQWITDIAHELRTPIQVLSSQVEAIQDGIIEANEQNMSSISSQIAVLGALVEDLYTLSLTDEKANIDFESNVDIFAIIEASLVAKEQHFKQKNIEVTRTYKNHKPCTVKADPKSLMRVFSNIMENSIRYTDDGGKFRATMDCNDTHVVLKFEDSTPGVSDESLNKIFDRLYRVDQSRSRAKGGAGLGLPICKNIIALHNGTLCSSHSPLGGLTLTITMPLEKNVETNK